jgi:hypothetical protein
MTVQSIIMGLVIGSLFYQLAHDQFSDRMGLLLYVIMFGAFANLTELPVASEARNVIAKQIDAGFYPAPAYTLSVNIMHLPITIIEALIFGQETCERIMGACGTRSGRLDAYFISFSFSPCLCAGTLVYWLPGFAPDAGRFFFFLFIMFLNSNALSVFFRGISYVSTTAWTVAMGHRGGVIYLKLIIVTDADMAHHSHCCSHLCR